jgi:hypothetical protein
MIPLHLSLNKDSCVFFSTIDSESVSVVWIVWDISVKSDDDELVWIVFIKECDRYSHDAVTSSA